MSGNLHLPPFAAGFGVYVHWPFCLAKCPYCDFNSHVRKGMGAAGGWDEAAFLAAYRRELRHMAALAPAREVSSIFFGGGTPSLMQPATVAGILDEIGALWSLASDIEITLEANPSAVEAGRFAGYRAAGVNRVSLGVQSLDPDDLARLGRKHTVAEALAAVALARRHFPRVSFDLIYARPGLGLAGWRRELGCALDLEPSHLSLYQLTIEPGTTYARLHAAGKLHLPEEELALGLYAATQEICAARGLPAYEVSNHARPGEESRHNLIYWRYGEYAGVGPGAHGRLYTERGRRALASERLPETWCEAVLRQGHALIVDDTLSGGEEGDEFLLMGLRLAEGIDPARYARLAGKPLDPARIRRLSEAGLIETTPQGRLRATGQGFPVLNAVLAELAL